MRERKEVQVLLLSKVILRMDAQKKHVMELISKHASELAEHVESVRIFVTVMSDADSDIWFEYSEGRGNIYSQIGQVGEWLERQRERVRIDENTPDDKEDNG